MKQRIVKLFTWLVVLGGLGALVASQMAHKPAEKKENAKREPKPISVTIESPVIRPVQRSVRGVGTIFGCEEIPISTKVEGRVVRLHKRVGDIVKPGDLLLELDPTDYQLAVNEAQRMVELELTKLSLQQMPAPGKFDPKKVPGVMKAMALETLALARKERSMKANTSMSLDEKQQLAAEYEVAKTNVSQAVLEAEATLAAARQRQATLDTLLQRLSDCRIIAPTPGTIEATDPTSQPAQVEYVVAARSVSEGEMLRILPGTSESLLKLVIDRPLKLMVKIPERFRPELAVNQEVQLEVETSMNEMFRGVVARIYPAVEKSSRTFQVEIRIPNDDRRLAPGSFAWASILTKLDPKVTLVPEEAIVRFAGVTKIFVQEGEKAREIVVETGISVEINDKDRSRTFTEVRGTIPTGAKVITSGQTQLADGSMIRVRE
jgi:RND family efflux transporter MFP subunit